MVVEVSCGDIVMAEKREGRYGETFRVSEC